MEEYNLVTGKCSACGDEYSYEIPAGQVIFRHKGYTDLCDGCLYEKIFGPVPENGYDSASEKSSWNGIPNESAWFENGVRGLEASLEDKF